MKSLTLLRHAKSGWDDPAMRDFDRPLTDRGRQAARRLGHYWRDEGIAFDHVLASPAVRVAETLSEAARGYGRGFDPVEDRRLYLAPAALLLDLIHTLPVEVARVLLVGHNPGMEQLVSILTRPSADAESSAGESFPTTAFAEFSFDGDHWGIVIPGAGTLTRFVCPRDLGS